MAWPDNTPVIDTTNFLNDAGTVTGATGARNEMVTLIDRLNQALDTIPEGDTPYSETNSAALMKTLAGGLNNDIGLVNSTGNPIRSGKTISTTVGTTDSTVPTSQGVREYVAAVGPSTPSYPVCAVACRQDNNGTTINYDYNVSTGTLGSDIYTVNFTSPLPNTAYYVSLNVDVAGNQTRVGNIRTKSTTNLTYEVFNSNGATVTDHTAVDVIVMQVPV